MIFNNLQTIDENAGADRPLIDACWQRFRKACSWPGRVVARRWTGLVQPWCPASFVAMGGRLSKSCLPLAALVFVVVMGATLGACAHGRKQEHAAGWYSSNVRRLRLRCRVTSIRPAYTCIA